MKNNFAKEKIYQLQTDVLMKFAQIRNELIHTTFNFL
jgi:hypothetical protein